MYFDILENS